MNINKIAKQKWSISNLTLIGWGDFDMQDISISTSGTTMLAAINGSGKTTILDAIITVLNGADMGASKIGFNSLDKTQRKSERSLNSYSLGQNETDNGVKREVSNTWIALSLTHTDSKLKQSLIVYLHADNEKNNGRLSDNIIKKILILDGYEVRKEDFLKKENNSYTPMSFDEWILNFKNFSSVVVFKKTSEYKKQLLKNVGAYNGNPLSDNFFRNLKMMMTKRNVDDFDGFVRDSILPNQNINVDSMRGLIEFVDGEKKAIDYCKLLIDDVGVIVKNTDDLISSYEKREKLNKQLLLTNAYALYSQIKKNENNIKENEKKLIDITAKLNNYESNKEKLIEARDVAVKARDNNNISDMIKDYKNQKEIIELKLKNYTNECNSILKTAKEIAIKINTIFQANITIDNKEDINLLINWIDEHKKNINDLLASSNDIDNSKIELIKTKDYYDSLLKSKENLENNKKSLPKNSIKLMKDLLDNNIKAKYVFETVTSLDEEWRVALEVVIGEKRTSIIVDDCDYEKSIEILHKSGVVKASIIHPKIKDDNHTINHNSLYSKIECNNETANSFFMSILNTIHCAESIKELSSGKYRNAIVSKPLNGTLTRISNWSTFNMEEIKPIDFLMLNLSPEEYKKELSKLIEEIANIKNKILVMSMEIKKAENNIKLLQEISNYFDNFNTNELSCFVTIDKHTEDYTNVCRLLKEKEEDSSMASLIKAVEDATIACNNNDKNIRVYSYEKGNINDKINKDKKEFEVNYPQYKESCEKANLIIDDVIEKPEFLPQNENPYIFIRKLRDAIFVSEKNYMELIPNYVLNVDKIKIKDGHKENNDIINCPYFNLPEQSAITIDLIKENNKFYINFIKVQSETTLVDKEESLNEWKEKFIKTFREDYVGKCYSLIYENSELIKSLNISLKDIVCNGKEYKFITKIKPEYEILNDFILRAFNSVESFDSVYNNSENIEIISSFIDKIRNNNVDLLDPKFWFTYDLSVKTVDGSNKTINMSQRAGYISGGEKATPFYVCMCAALMAGSYGGDKNNGGLCLGIFDESFEKIDSGSISEIFKMFESSGIQVIICDPGKNSILESLCSKIVYLNKYANDVYIDIVNVGENVKKSFIEESPDLKGEKAFETENNFS